MRRVKYNMTTMPTCKVEFSNYPKLKQRTMLQICVLHTMFYTPCSTMYFTPCSTMYCTPYTSHHVNNNELHTMIHTPCTTMQHSRHPGDTIANSYCCLKLREQTTREPQTWIQPFPPAAINVGCGREEADLTCCVEALLTNISQFCLTWALNNCTCIPSTDMDRHIFGAHPCCWDREAAEDLSKQQSLDSKPSVQTKCPNCPTFFTVPCLLALITARSIYGPPVPNQNWADRLNAKVRLYFMGFWSY